MLTRLLSRARSRAECRSRALAIGSLLVIPALASIATGCRGDLSQGPPIHIVQNMDQQARYDPQEPNTSFADGRAMRPPVPGTIARGSLRDDPHFFNGRREGGEYATTLPTRVALNKVLLNRGRERYDIYCSPCHDQAGSGDGIIARRGYPVPPTNLASDPTRALPAGQIFETISNGVRTMPGYREQIPVPDRWAIVAYVRALQVSQHASVDLVPQEVTTEKGWSVK
ncbi:MAG: cytochrome c [Candidatus Schekmanbacteria bacterium]|nr:cytochrome c [Candidatus Schekmanbacteria bacterium]